MSTLLSLPSMESRIHLDKEIDIPISLIDDSPWNPKEPIHGIYRVGLSESLKYFGVRLRLIVWPHPKRRGRYWCLDGNQRKSTILEHILNIKIRDHFSLDPSISDSQFNKLKSSDENLQIIEKLRKSCLSWKAPCQVITHLDAETPLTEEDARLFTLTFNRNYSKYDEVKTSNVYRDILRSKVSNASEERRKSIEVLLKRMVRPELPLISPQTPGRLKIEGSTNDKASDSSGIHQQSQPGFEFSKPGEFTPTADAPWGPSPPDRSLDSSHPSQPPKFVPLVFSLTADSYQQITSSLLRSRSRVFREEKLKTALEKLELVLGTHPSGLQSSKMDDIIDSVIVETALLSLEKNIQYAQSPRGLSEQEE